MSLAKAGRILLVAGLVVLMWAGGPVGAVDEPVKSKSGAVTQTDQLDYQEDGTKRTAKEQPSDADATSAESVKLENGMIEIISKTFTPPGKLIFKPFGGEAGPWVDFEVDPTSCQPSEVGKSGIKAIKVKAVNVPLTAVMFPLQCEGNLIQLLLRGGGVYAQNEWHWSAKMASREATVLLAFTFDDGPHVLLTGKTVAIINTLKQKQTQYNKPIKVTFFVEHSRITPAIKDHMTANDHEIACHGADPVEHHLRHQLTPDLPAKITAMKGIISSAEAGGQTASSVRPPYGWGGEWGEVLYNREQLTAIYAEANLRRYTGEGTDGVNSWGPVYPSSGETAPSAAARAAFIKTITDVIDAAWAAAGEAADRKATKKLVILMHDIRTPDKNDIGPIIDEVETYAANKGVKTEYKRVKDF
jgi:peptidoglycan/xylan/chitin deacetylase (PgdA/CDA1 family)